MCKRYTELIQDAREGHLTGFALMQVKIHKKICAMCKAYVAGIDTTVAALHEMPAEPAPEETKAAVLQRLREKRGG